jgi:DNA-binding CsgD family transcriptional regulator
LRQNNLIIGNLHVLGERSKLTPREMSVLSLLLTNARIACIARELSISHNTAKTHIRHIYTKVGVNSVEALRLQLLKLLA